VYLIEKDFDSVQHFSTRKECCSEVSNNKGSCGVLFQRQKVKHSKFDDLDAKSIRSSPWKDEAGASCNVVHFLVSGHRVKFFGMSPLRSSSTDFMRIEYLLGAAY
jgi:hypothetical protein